MHYDPIVTPKTSLASDVLETALARYRAATPGSAAMFEKASRRLPAGVTSNVKFFPPYPVYLHDARRGRARWDVDGREYLDYCLAFGPLVTGHGHPRVSRPCAPRLSRAGTLIFGAPTRSGAAPGRASRRRSCRRPRWCGSPAPAPRRRCTRCGWRAARRDAVAHRQVRGPLPRRARPRAVEPRSAAAAQGRRPTASPKRPPRRPSVLPWNDIAALVRAALDATRRHRRGDRRAQSRAGCCSPTRRSCGALRDTDDAARHRPDLRRGRRVAARRAVGRAGPVWRDARSDRARQGDWRRPAAGRARRDGAT